MQQFGFGATLLFTVLVMSAPAKCASASERFSTIAVTGMSEQSSGVAFQAVSDSGHYLYAPVINGQGQVAFTASVAGQGIGIDNDQGLWVSSRDGSLMKILHEGDQVPGTDFSLGGFSYIRLNDSGEIAFQTLIQGPAVDLTNDLSVWTNAGGSGLELVAREGDPAPGSTLIFENLYLEGLSESGNVLVSGKGASPNPVSGLESDGIWKRNVGEPLQVVALEGEPVPGDSEIPYRVGSTVLSGSGDTIFSTRSFDEFETLWRENASTYQAVVRQGDPVPETSLFIDSASKAELNDQGKIAFAARLTDQNGTTQRDSIWSDRSGVLAELPYRSGEMAPGTNGLFDDFQELVLNNSQQLAFVAQLNGGDVDPYDEGLWVENTEGDLSLVAYGGDLAPGTDFPFKGSFQSPIAMNDAGQVAFLGRVIEPTDSRRPRSATGIWATDLGGNLHLIALTTGTDEDYYLDVSDDASDPDFRLVTELNFGPQGFNNAGELVFQAIFEDGSSGVFVSTAVSGDPGDYNNDGTVNMADYTVWRNKLGATGIGLAADGNGDAVVDAADYIVWKSSFGQSAESGITGVQVPEPATWLILGWVLALPSVIRKSRSISW